MDGSRQRSTLTRFLNILSVHHNGGELKFRENSAFSPTPIPRPTSTMNNGVEEIFIIRLNECPSHSL